MQSTQCSIVGCEREHRARGLCLMHYKRARKSGVLAQFLGSRDRSPAERLTARLVRMPNGCLEWTGSKFWTGYGQIKVDGKNMKTHRFAWELANGPIPDGMIICHRCDNPPCCDVVHLFLGTHQDNVDDMMMKGRGVNPQSFKTHCPRNHEYTTMNTRVLASGSRQCRTCDLAHGRARRSGMTIEAVLADPSSSEWRL